MAAQAAGDSSLGSFHDGAGEDVGFWFLVAARTRIGEWHENGHHGAASHTGSGKATKMTRKGLSAPFTRFPTSWKRCELVSP